MKIGTNRPSSGGLGLTGGIADVGSLYDALVALKNGQTDDSILDKYSEVRRKKWAEIIDPMSRANFRRVCLDEAESERNEFWNLCDRMEQDEELARQMAQVATLPQWVELRREVANICREPMFYEKTLGNTWPRS